MNGQLEFTSHTLESRAKKPQCIRALTRIRTCAPYLSWDFYKSDGRITEGYTKSPNILKPNSTHPNTPTTWQYGTNRDVQRGAQPGPLYRKTLPFGQAMIKIAIWVSARKANGSSHRGRCTPPQPRWNDLKQNSPYTGEKRVPDNTTEQLGLAKLVNQQILSYSEQRSRYGRSQTPEEI